MHDIQTNSATYNLKNKDMKDTQACLFLLGSGAEEHMEQTVQALDFMKKEFTNY